MKVIEHRPATTARRRSRERLGTLATLSALGLLAGSVLAARKRERRLRIELERAAQRDPLTGLMNRQAFNAQLARLIGAASSEPRPLVVAMFDIDHFNHFNDQHGYLAGDDALRRVGEALRCEARKQDVIARFGGEEFAVVLPGADCALARDYVERVAASLWREPADSGVRLSTSAGVAELSSATANLDALLSGADHALGAAKQAGRSRTAWFDGELHVGDSFLELAAADAPPVPVEIAAPGRIVFHQRTRPQPAAHARLAS
jgi:diguanylate cyclase (GGDEF)-like protein